MRRAGLRIVIETKLLRNEIGTIKEAVVILKLLSESIFILKEFVKSERKMDSLKRYLSPPHFPGLKDWRILM